MISIKDQGVKVNRNLTNLKNWLSLRTHLRLKYCKSMSSCTIIRTIKILKTCRGTVMKLNKELAKLYYTAAEARKELGLDEEAFQYWVRRDRIKKVILPGRSQGVYSRKEVNEMRNQINATIVAEQIGTEFRKATVDDIEQEAKLAHLVFGAKAEAIAERKAFLERNPNIDYHLYDQGTLVAYIIIVPMKKKAIEDFLHAKMGAWLINPDNIEQFIPGEPRECLIIDMVTTPNVPPLARTTYGAKLLTGLIKVLANEGRKGIEITEIYAASDTPQGIRILRNAGFEEMYEARKGRFSYKLDVTTSKEKILKEYQDALKEWKEAENTK